MKFWWVWLYLNVKAQILHFEHADTNTIFCNDMSTS